MPKIGLTLWMDRRLTNSFCIIIAQHKHSETTSPLSIQARDHQESMSEVSGDGRNEPWGIIGQNFDLVLLSIFKTTTIKFHLHTYKWFGKHF